MTDTFGPGPVVLPHPRQHFVGYTKVSNHTLLPTTSPTKELERSDTETHSNEDEKKVFHLLSTCSHELNDMEETCSLVPGDTEQIPRLKMILTKLDCVHNFNCKKHNCRLFGQLLWNSRQPPQARSSELSSRPRLQSALNHPMKFATQQTLTKFSPLGRTFQH